MTSLLLVFALAVPPEAAASDAPPPTRAPSPEADEAEVDGDGREAPQDAAAEGAASGADDRRSALRLAVYDFELTDVDPRLGRVVTDAVIEELRKHQRLSVIGMDEVRQMLDHEAAKAMAGCSDDTSCLSDIADALGVDGLLTGTLARVGEQTVFGMRRIDQREAKVVGSLTKRLAAAGGGEEILAAVGPAVAELFPDLELRPGKARGVDPELALKLNPPPLPVWTFWTGMGTAGAVAVVAAGLGLASFFVTYDYAATLNASATTLVSGQELHLKEQLSWGVAIAAWVTAGVAVLIAGGTGLSAFFVDWRGYGDVAEPPSEE